MFIPPTSSSSLPLRLPPQETTVANGAAKVDQLTMLKNQALLTSTEDYSDTHFEYKAKMVENVLKKKHSLQDCFSSTNMHDSNYFRNSHNPFSSFNEYAYEDNEEWDDDDEDLEAREVAQSPQPSRVEFAVAFAPFEPTDPETQLSLKVSNIVEVHEKTNSNWWRGKLKGDTDSSLKWIPASCVTIFDVDGLGLNHFQKKEEEDCKNDLVRFPSLRPFSKHKQSLQEVTTANKSSSSLSRWNSSASLSSTASASKSPESHKSSPSFKSVFSKFFKRSTSVAEDAGDEKKVHLERSPSRNEQVAREKDNSTSEDSTSDHTSLCSYSQLLYTVQTMTTSAVRDSEEEVVKDPKVELAKRRQNIIYDLVATEGKYIKDLYFALKVNF